MGFFKRLFGLESTYTPKQEFEYDFSATEPVSNTAQRPILPPQTTAKRGRGRPRRTPLETGINSLARPIRPISDGGTQVKRGRGRPRKTEVAAAPVLVAAAKKPKKGKATKKGKPAKKGY
jgi:hypothetical protein